MVKPQTDLFWKALIFTIIIFVIGVYLGIVLEESRLGAVQEEFDDLVIRWGDLRLQSYYYQSIDEISCEEAIDENLKFGDRVYEDGLLLEEYEQANRLTDKLEFEKKKYNLLKTEFYINSLVLKDKCNANYDVLVYFYLDGTEDLDLGAQQSTVSRVLGEVKEQYGPNLILIPLAADMDISVINILLDSYNIESFPSIWLDSGVVLEGVHSLEDIISFLSPPPAP
tara:strand:+ start:997 stop:1671 length:675 start_codon:yes stop_codon:yes gene_type:complete